MMKTPKEKPLDPCQGEAAQETKLNSDNNPQNALLQWHALATNVKDSRVNRQQKRGWKRGRK